HHAQLAGVERLQLLRCHVDALDLAAILEMARDLRVLDVEGLALQEFRQLRPRLAPLPGLLLLPALGLEALFLLLLRAQRIGPGEVDLLLETRGNNRGGGTLPAPAVPAILAA